MTERTATIRSVSYPVTFVKRVTWYVCAKNAAEAQAAAERSVERGEVDALGPYEWEVTAGRSIDVEADCKVENGEIVSLVESPL